VAAVTASAKGVQRLTLWFLILVLIGFFTHTGELPKWRYPDPCGAFAFGRSVFGGCDGLGGPPESSTPMQRLVTVLGNIRYSVEQIIPANPFGID
jgi:hypothetical protein